MTKENPQFHKALSRTLISRLWVLIRAERKKYAVVCLMGLILAGLEMIPPRLVGRSVDIMASGPFEMADVLKLVGLWALIALVTQVLHGFQINLATRCGERVLCSVRENVFNHLQRLSMNFFDRVHVGRIIACMGSDLNSLYSILTWGLNTVTSNAFFMIFASLMIITTDLKLFLATFWLAPLMTLMNFLYGRKISEAWQAVRHHSALVGANQAENIDGARVVAAFNRQESNLIKYNELQAINTANQLLVSHRTGMFQPILQWIRFSGQAIILLYGGYRVVSGNLKPGDLVAVSLYWEWFMMPAVNFGNFINELIASASGAERVFSILDEEPQVKDQPGAKALPPIRGRVRFENVTFAYQAGHPVIRDMNIDIPSGVIVALVGATGSGKSTILSLLARFYEPQQGRILIDGYDLKTITNQSLHDQMAMVLQNNYLFSGTIMHNLRYGRPGASDEEVIAAAKTLGAHERILAFKNGYDTWVGDKGMTVSLGERQLICFTRALIHNPRILLLDEATSALDPITDMHVQTALRKLTHGRTTFVVTHRLNTAERADLILMLEHGRLVESGTHSGLIARGGAYARLYTDSVKSSQKSEREPALDSAMH